MKKMFALMLAAMMLLAMMPAAMAYTAVKPTANTPTLSQKLQMSDEKSAGLAYTITYKYTVDNKPMATAASGIANLDAAVTGFPAISDVTFSPADTNTDAYNPANRTYTKALTINWNNVSITEPGVYAWKVTQTASDDDQDSSQFATTTRSTAYLYVVVTAQDADLTVAGTFISDRAPDALTYDDQNTGKGDYTDSYPAKTLDLILSKTVTGNQGSRDKYFKFVISLESPDKTNNSTHTLSAGIEGTTYDNVVPDTAYMTGTANRTSIELVNGAASNVEIWLKHGQSVKIPNLPFGTKYTIQEDASYSSGYEITDLDVTGDASGINVSKENGSASDGSLQATTTVAYTNEKNATVPTGIELETAAPIVGMILAMAMLALLFVGKRKEEIA